MSKFIIIQQQDGTEQPFVEADLPIVIGSKEDAHIRLEGVEPVCAYIAQDKGHFFIQPSGKNGEALFHNGHHLTSSAWLKSHDKIRVGHHLIFYKLNGDRVIISVTENAEDQPLHKELQPPSQPPPDHPISHETDQQIPVAVPAKRLSDRKRKAAMVLVGLLALVLGCAVFFVLSAKPLQLNITPEPDKISFEGFPPPIAFGSRFLGLPGEYRISIEKEGYVPITRPITITRETENLFSATLEKLPGILNLTVIPAGRVDVYSDDQLLGSSPPGTIEIPAGVHHIKLVRERYLPYLTKIEIEGRGIRQELEANLKPAWAAITITSEPPGAAIDIDHKPVGTTPLTLDLLNGSHSLLLAKKLFIDAKTDIVVSAGKTEQHHISLQPLPGQLTLLSQPGQATVRINKIYKGSTPLTIDLFPNKEHEIIVSLPGFHTARTTISLTPGEKKQSELILEQEKGIIYLLITPPDAVATLDGRRLDKIQGRLSLSVEPHTLEVKAAGYLSQGRTIVPKTGFSQQVSIDLEPLTEKLISGSGGKAPHSPVKNSADHKLLFIQPSSFIMGAPRREPGRRANEHERSINMTKPFYLSQKPVTNRQFRLFNKKHVSGAFAGNSLNDAEYPVVNITWEDAIRYLNWLSDQDGLKPFYRKQGSSFIAVSPPTNGYRLPTEAEWAFSARQVGSPTTQRFPWSGGFPPRMATSNFADESARSILPNVIDGYNDGFPVASPVGTFPPNKGGFFDMGGNVAEWCHDFYSPFPPSGGSPNTLTDPLGPPTGTHHVIRGSSWRDSSITELRLSYRSYHREARNNVGFRVARY